MLALVLLFTLLLPCTIVWASASDQGAEQERMAMPGWYPENWADFQSFYDPNAPQLTDTADIFTEKEEVIREQLKALRETYGTDFVVFTDVSTCGLSRKVYAADFFEATGHGLGDDFSGMILFICMEEGNRGWWTAARGSVKPLFSEKAINWLDDRLEPYRTGSTEQVSSITWTTWTPSMRRVSRPCPGRTCCSSSAGR